MHKDEKWQIYASNGEPILGAGWDSALDNPEKTNSDAIVGVAVVFLYRKNRTGTLELLWQKRSDQVDRHPGKYDISAGGHINLGETVAEGAVRECFEEIGAKITTKDLCFVTMTPFNRNRFAWVFVVDWTGREEDFHFDDHEVSEVRWVPYAELGAFRESFAKEPLKKDKFTFAMLDSWFRMHGVVGDKEKSRDAGGQSKP